jgi:hypothetical protein
LRPKQKYVRKTRETIPNDDDLLVKSFIMAEEDVHGTIV